MKVLDLLDLSNLLLLLDYTILLICVGLH